MTRTFTADLSKSARRAHRSRQQTKLDANRTLSKRTFGIEIEYVGTPLKRQVAEALSLALGEHVHVTGYHSNTCYTCGRQDVAYGEWKVSHDGSLGGRGYGADSTTGEIVSPVLTGEEGIDKVKIVLATLRAVGAKASAKCGIHIHAGAKDLTANGLQRLVKNYGQVQDEIYTWLPSRRASGPYSPKLRTRTLDSLYLGVKQFKEQGYGGDLGTKYSGLNISPLARIGTVEFRMHQGSVDTNIIAPWIRFVVGFIDSQVDDEDLVGTTIATNESVLTYLVDGKYLPVKSAEKIAQRVGRWN